MKMDWFGPQANAAIRQRLAANLYDADETILDHARELIDTPGPPRSSPGDPPHVDSSRLLDSLFGAVDEDALRSRIGSSEEHSVYTEIGTPEMDARPWFSRAIIEASDDAARELAK